MRRQSLTPLGETIQSLMMAGGVAGLMIGVGAAFMPSDRMMILFKYTAPYSLVLAGATALVVGPDSRRKGYNDAVDRFQGVNQGVSPQVQQIEEPIRAQLPPVFAPVVASPTWSQSAPQQHYSDSQSTPVAAHGPMDVASNGHRQPINRDSELELY